MAQQNQIDSSAKKEDANFHSDEKYQHDQMLTGNSIQKALNKAGEREVSGFTLKRDSSEEI